MTLTDTEYTAARLKDKIQHIRTNLRLLEDIATKRVHFTNPTGSGQRRDSAPTPINLAATDLLDQIDALSVLLGQAVGLHPPLTIRAHSILPILIDEPYLTALATRRDAPDILQMLTEAAQQSDRMIDPESPNVVLGRCPHCEAVLTVRRDQPTSPGLWNMCRMCGRDYNIGQVQRAQLARLAAANIVDDDAEIRRLLKTAGIEVSASFLRVARHRGSLTDLGKNDKGHNLYALAEVYMLVKPPGSAAGFDTSNCNA